MAQYSNKPSTDRSTRISSSGLEKGLSSRLRVTRRSFLLLLGSPLLSAKLRREVPEDLKTPYKLNRLVVPPSDKPGTFDERGADVPFVFRHGGSFYMTYVGFDGKGYQTGLASSSNLIDWKKEGLIIGRDPSNPIIRHNAALTWILRENDVFSGGKLKKVGGRYLGAYHAYPKPGYEEGPAVIGLCWSRDLLKWDLAEPCLRPEDGGAWEQGGLYKACIVQDAGIYYLFYNAKDRAANWKEQTGFATSMDLKTWIRYSGNPVIRNGPPGSPDEVFASDPCVLKYGDQWAIFYYGLDAKHVARDLLALSHDFRQTTKFDGVLIDVGPPGSVDSKYAHKPSIVFHEGVLYHFYCAVSSESRRGISVATSRPV